MSLRPPCINNQTGHHDGGAELKNLSMLSWVCVWITFIKEKNNNISGVVKMKKTLNKWRSPASMITPRQNMKSIPRPHKERVQHTETITARRAPETRGKISNIYQETGEVRPGNVGGAAIWGVNEIGIHHGTRRCRRLTRPLFQYASSPRNLHADNSGPQSDGVGVDVAEQSGTRSGVAWKEKNNKGIKVSSGTGGGVNSKLEERSWTRFNVGTSPHEIKEQLYSHIYIRWAVGPLLSKRSQPMKKYSPPLDAAMRDMHSWKMNAGKNCFSSLFLRSCHVFDGSQNVFEGLVLEGVQTLRSG